MVTVLAFGAVTVRLVDVQAMEADRYAAFGRSQRLRSMVLPAERGFIFDRNGLDLALSVKQKTVYANPRLVHDPAGDARRLAAVLGVDAGLLRDRLSRDAAFVYLARRVPDSIAARVEAMQIPGIDFIDEPTRFNPAGSLAAPVLGRVGTDNTGLSGLELLYDRRLTGKPGELMRESDPRGRAIASGFRQVKPARRGDDLMLTLDRSLQYETERALAEQIVASAAKGGIAIVSDPRTGEILALANLVAGTDGGPPRTATSNMALTNVYEPGSVNKVITIAASLQEGRRRPSDVLRVPDRLLVADHVFSDHDPHPPTAWSVTDIIARSSNIGTIMLAKELGRDVIDEYLRAFGFGAKTAIDFPGESGGILLESKKWSGTSIGTIPIGQGVAVTAVQMLAVYNTIANDGVYVQPRLVKAFVDDRGRERPIETDAPRRVVSEDVARQVRAMLTEVVRVGTGANAAIDGYGVAGKTGTARKPRVGARGYALGAYVSSFAGFVPAERPALSAIVILDEPTPIYGGVVAAPVFARIARYGLRRFRIPPATASTKAMVPKLQAKAVRPDEELDVRAPASPATARR